VLAEDLIMEHNLTELIDTVLVVHIKKPSALPFLVEEDLVILGNHTLRLLKKVVVVALVTKALPLRVLDQEGSENKNS